MAKRTGRGRPTKLTPEVRAIIVASLEAGSFVDTACILAGINQRTFYNWLRRGRDAKSGQFRDFFLAIKKALAEAEVSAVRGIRDAGKNQWQAFAWFLERRFREKWAKDSDRGMAMKSTAPSEQAKT